jgi:hypothetical protein
MYTYDMDLNIDYWGDTSSNAVVSAVDPDKEALDKLRRYRRSSVGGPRIASNIAATMDKDEADIEAAVNAKAAEKKKTPTIIMKPYTQSVWENDEEIVELRRQVNDSFRQLWNDGFAAFIKGDWQKARDIFHETMKLSEGQDGPSKFLIEVIDEHGGTAPQDWNGYRNEGGGGH